MTDWHTWSRIVDAAQDPRHRNAVQQFLVQAELSADIPPAIDEKFLAPRREAGASGEECAYLLCNLGFAALVAGSQQSAEFAIACGRVAERHAPDHPDLELRRGFLSSKGASILALLADQPHILWAEALECCSGYMSAIDRRLEILPGEAVEPNAMAAYSFAGQLLQRLRSRGTAGFYSREIGRLVSTALDLAGRLPPSLMPRLWQSILPGTDASILFRLTGALAERTLRLGAGASDAASIGIAYADDVLSEPGRLSGSELAELRQYKAELLLQAGREAEAREIARSLADSPNEADRRRSTTIEARRLLLNGDPQSTSALLDKIAPVPGRVVDDWCASWLGESDDGHWTSDAGMPSGFDPARETRGLQALAAAASNDSPGVVAAADRFGGFLADSIMTDRGFWSRKLGRSGDVEIPATEAAEPVTALHEILETLGDGTAVVQVARIENTLLTVVARRKEGETSIRLSPDPCDARGLCAAHRSWDRSRFDAIRGDADRDVEVAFSALMGEVRRVWQEPLDALLDDGLSQVVFVGDDFIDTPLHALRIGGGDECLAERVPVAWAPSLNVLRASVASVPSGVSLHNGARLGVLGSTEAGAAEADAIASALGSDPIRLVSPADARDWQKLADCGVLHLDARLRLNGQRPFESVLESDEMSLTISDLMTRLNLPQGALVSALACETALAAMSRAPGFDVATTFLAAGARNVLSSAWETERELAADLTRTFFERRAEGETPSVAFGQALTALRSAKPSLPDVAWAGMRMVGAP
jgi:hypothetical protein